MAFDINNFGKSEVSIGSAPGSDVLLQGPGVAPHHARIVNVGGVLGFVDGGTGPSTANGSPLVPRQSLPFDFRTQFAVGEVPVPLSLSPPS